MYMSIVFILFCYEANAWNDQKNEAVLLRDINVLTLHHGRMSTARRSSPVPQVINQALAIVLNIEISKV